MTTPTNEPVSTRREFTSYALRSLTAVALLEGLAAHRLFGKDVAPVVDAWFKDLHEISKDVADHKTKDVAFQKALEGLYARVDLPALRGLAQPWPGADGDA